MGGDMKTRLVFRGCGLLVVLAAAVSLGAAPAKTAPKPAAATAAKPAKPAEEPAPKIEGTVIARPAGFMGLKISDNHFVLTFYDAERKKPPPDVASAALRWPVKYQPGPERTTLTPDADGFSLSSPKTVRPPRNFKVFITLLREGDEETGEGYAVDFSD
jgi:hypothetical protein